MPRQSPGSARSSRKIPLTCAHLYYSLVRFQLDDQIASLKGGARRALPFEDSDLIYSRHGGRNGKFVDHRKNSSSMISERTHAITA